MNINDIKCVEKGHKACKVAVTWLWLALICLMLLEILINFGSPHLQSVSKKCFLHCRSKVENETDMNKFINTQSCCCLSTFKNAKLFIFKTIEAIFIQTEKLRHYGKKKSTRKHES